MANYVSGVDPAYIYKRQGTSQDPYISRNETAQVVSGIVTLAEIPDSVNKVSVIKTDGTILTEVTTSTLSTNQYRVDYTSGVVYFNSSLEGSMVTSTYKGTGYVSFPSSRIWIDTGGQNSNKTLQQMFTDIDNLKTHWLTAVNAFSDIATTYPSPSLGDTVQTVSDGKIYRFDGTTWINTTQYNANAITDVQNKIGDLTTLQTTAKSNLVSAINENQGKVTLIGNLSNLNTTTKDNLVNSINENVGKLGDLNTLQTTAKSTLVSAINENQGKLGDLTTLQTTAKSTLVGAINEQKGKIDTNISSLGDITTLQTTNKSTVVAAVNEIKSQSNTNATSISTNSTNIGNLTNLSTTNKSSLVNAINEHVGKTNNPHGVSASQVGAYTTSQVDSTFAKITQPDWINAVYQNQWATNDGTPLAYMKDNFGFVYIRGSITGGVTSNGTVIFTLPQGYRPQYKQHYVIPCYTGTTWGNAEIVVNTDGTVVLNNGYGSYYPHLYLPPFKQYQ